MQLQKKLLKAIQLQVHRDAATNETQQCHAAANAAANAATPCIIIPCLIAMLHLQSTLCNIAIRPVKNLFHFFTLTNFFLTIFFRNHLFVVPNFLLNTVQTVQTEFRQWNSTLQFIGSIRKFPNQIVMIMEKSSQLNGSLGKERWSSSYSSSSHIHEPHWILIINPRYVNCFHGYNGRRLLAHKMSLKYIISLLWP